MSPTGKAGRPRNKPPVLEGETQFERFVETAKALEADESGASFKRAMDVIVPVSALKKKSTDSKIAQSRPQTKLRRRPGT